MCKTTEIIDSIFRYIIVALLSLILYVLICLVNVITNAEAVNQQQLADIIGETVRAEFKYDRQNYKFIIEE